MSNLPKATRLVGNGTRRSRGWAGSELGLGHRAVPTAAVTAPQAPLLRSRARLLESM